MAIQIACDGSCIQPTGYRVGDDTLRPGAAGFVARLVDGRTVGRAEPQPNGLIGGMEVKALLMGLRFASELRERLPEAVREPIAIVCDSQYAVKGFNEWLPGWAAKGYHKKGGLAYPDEWREIDSLKKGLGPAVEVSWVKGHSDHPLNNMVDELVNSAARSQTGFDDTRLVFPEGGADVRREAGPEHVSKSDPARSDVPMGALHMQAAALLKAVADDPQMSGLLAAGLEMALDERRVMARYPIEKTEEAEHLRAILEKRSMER